MKERNQGSLVRSPDIEFPMTISNRLEMPSSNDKLIWDICFSTYQFPCLTVAAELGLFPLLAKTPLTASEIAKGLSISSRGTEALLAMIAGMGLITKREGRFYLTDVARNYLLPDSPYCWIGMFHMLRKFPVNHEGLMEALKKDMSSLFDGKVWESFQMSPDIAKMVTQAMHSHSLPSALGVARWGDFQGITHLLDAGGGSGCFSIALAMAHPEIRCTVMDLPPVCEIAAQYAEVYGVSDRVKTLPRDMIKEDWPTGHNGVFFSNIFHDWDMKLNSQLTKKCYDSLPSGGAMYLHEALLDDNKDGPVTIAGFSMAMLVGTQGKQFTATELKDLLSENGFEDITVTQTYGYYALIKGRKP